MIASPAPETEFKQASVQPNPPIVDFQTDARIPEQSVAPVEQEIAPPQPSLRPRPAAIPEQKPAGGGQRSAISAGAVSAIPATAVCPYRALPASSGGERYGARACSPCAAHGTLVRLDVKSSSGRPLLDQEAIETIRRAQPLPRIPADMPDLITVLLPVAFDAR
ncbi:TonB family protein [Bradyrhizobium guangxiense]